MQLLAPLWAGTHAPRRHARRENESSVLVQEGWRRRANANASKRLQVLLLFYKTPTRRQLTRVLRIQCNVFVISSGDSLCFTEHSVVECPLYPCWLVQSARAQHVELYTVRLERKRGTQLVPVAGFASNIVACTLPSIDASGLDAADWKSSTQRRKCCSSRASCRLHHWQSRTQVLWNKYSKA